MSGRVEPASPAEVAALRSVARAARQYVSASRREATPAGASRWIRNCDNALGRLCYALVLLDEVRR